MVTWNNVQPPYNTCVHYAQSSQYHGNHLGSTLPHAAYLHPQVAILGQLLSMLPTDVAIGRTADVNEKAGVSLLVSETDVLSFGFDLPSSGDGRIPHHYGLSTIYVYRAAGCDTHDRWIGPARRDVSSAHQTLVPFSSNGDAWRSSMPLRRCLPNVPRCIAVRREPRDAFAAAVGITPTCAQCVLATLVPTHAYSHCKDAKRNLVHSASAVHVCYMTAWCVCLLPRRPVGRVTISDAWPWGAFRLVPTPPKRADHCSQAIGQACLSKNCPRGQARCELLLAGLWPWCLRWNCSYPSARQFTPCEYNGSVLDHEGTHAEGSVTSSHCLSPNCRICIGPAHRGACMGAFAQPDDIALGGAAGLWLAPTRHIAFASKGTTL